MKHSLKFYWNLFSSTFFLSAFTFGGGFVILPLMRKKFVEQYHWLEEEEMLDLTAVAQSSPGAIAVNASILVGYRLAGIPGALLTVLATILPPLVTISILSAGYTAFQSNQIVQAVLRGMQAAIAAVVVDVVIQMGKEIFHSHSVMGILILFASFGSVAFWKANPVLVVLGAAIVGVIASLIQQKRKERKK